MKQERYSLQGVPINMGIKEGLSSSLSDSSKMTKCVSKKNYVIIIVSSKLTEIFNILSILLLNYKLVSGQIYYYLRLFWRCKNG